MCLFVYDSKITDYTDEAEVGENSSSNDEAQKEDNCRGERKRLRQSFTAKR